MERPGRSLRPPLAPDAERGLRQRRSGGDEPTAAEEPLENYLTADWTLPTEIINGEAELEISAAAFAEASEVDRVISVVEIDAANETTTLLAEWNFGKAAYPDLTGSFDASVTVTKGENGAKTIMLNANSELLAKLQPTLTIPNASGGVKHNGEGRGVEQRERLRELQVSGGGTYEISEANPEIPVEPDIPSNPGMPTTPVEPGEARSRVYRTL